MVDILKDGLIYLIKILFDLYILTIIFRVLLQWVKIKHSKDYLVRFIFNVTDPLIKPIYSIIPSIGRIDMVAILYALGFSAIEWMVLAILKINHLPNIHGLFFWVTAELLNQLCNLYFYLILFQFLVSRLLPLDQKIFLDLLTHLTKPVASIARRVIPITAGLDIASIVILLLLQMIIIFIATPLQQWGMEASLIG
jgi:YggT family protein